MHAFIDGGELVPAQTVQAMLDARNQIVEMAATIRATKENIEKLLFVNTSSSYLPHQIEQSFFEPEPTRKYLDYAFWERIISECKLTNTMTEKAKTEYLHNIHENPPEFCESEVTALAQNMLGIYGNNIETTIKEVYRQLVNTEYSPNWREKKFNNCKKVERLFRIRGNIRRGWSGSGFHFESHERYYFNFDDLLKACYLLEGLGAVPYDKTIKALTDEQIKTTGDTITCEYFRIVCYRNGNHKVTWNDNKIKVLDDLNKYGSEGGLPDIYKKKYKPKHFRSEAEEDNSPITKTEAA